MCFLFVVPIRLSSLHDQNLIFSFFLFRIKIQFNVTKAIVHMIAGGLRKKESEYNK